MKIVLLGPPGSGKGTQARVLSQRLGLPHVSTGELFRRAIEKGNSLGEKVKHYVESGGLVPDELVIAVGNQRLSEEDCESGFILDGLPRTLAQAEALDEFLKERGLSLDVVLYFQVGEEEVVARLSGRRICHNCGANFHLEFLPPEVDGICDHCGAKLYQRSDDEPQKVRIRLKLYNEEIQPLVEYYRGNGLLRVIPASGSVEETTTNLLSALGLIS